MLYILSKGNANEWYSRATLPAWHRNGSTLPSVAIWPKNQLLDTLNGCHAIITLPYNCRGVSNALYHFEGQVNDWLVHGGATPLASHHICFHNTPCTNMANNQTNWQCNGCHTITTWPYNCRGVHNTLCALKGQCKWVAGLRRDYSASITL